MNLKNKIMDLVLLFLFFVFFIGSNSEVVKFKKFPAFYSVHTGNTISNRQRYRYQNDLPLQANSIQNRLSSHSKTFSNKLRILKSSSSQYRIAQISKSQKKKRGKKIRKIRKRSVKEVIAQHKRYPRMFWNPQPKSTNALKLVVCSNGPAKQVLNFGMVSEMGEIDILPVDNEQYRRNFDFRDEDLSDNHASFVTKHNKFVTNGTVYVVPFKVQSKENPPKTAFFEARVFVCYCSHEKYYGCSMADAGKSYLFIVPLFFFICVVLGAGITFWMMRRKNRSDHTLVRTERQLNNHSSQSMVINAEDKLFSKQVERS